jgi:hypothetical protein
MLEVLALLVSLAEPPHVAIPEWPRLATPAFRPAERALTNWAIQAALDLDLGTDAALRWLAGNVPANLPRCIRLNNYWCLKKAAWPGEIGADAEGHAAFASAGEGAGAAVILLRRYYLDYGRKSARAILAHWAPAQCDLSVAAAAANSQPSSTPLGPLAKYGIRNTLRARWLAAHRRGGTMATRGAGRKVAVRRSVVPDRLAPEPPLMLEPAIKTESLRVASISASPLSRSASLAPLPAVPAAPAPVTACTGESLRLANYAAHAIEGIAHSPDEDLKLFEIDGTPRSALTRLLANMAAVEIGPYRADGKLIDAAIKAVGTAPARTASARQ